uniref:Uncharacterized protein n=1 Tax=Candidatus Methanogaster sp. ANME-2c ERB4 TaxID=2759911 RepID=A0A7G9Y9M8_9EURY|nr:hypothetical protein HMEJMANM_00029 [Methanosarcinales archaeon ANME-2c ERB4]QNO43615.1 hypothetical protein LAPIAFBC_00022 [Methanosarcinales archaeon ANME-2c ERB4]QNO44712.1 hypothetical protein LCOPCFJD_00011 [Methanosarcinales archaeon ANME-2c ERB4]
MGSEICIKGLNVVVGTMWMMVQAIDFAHVFETQDFIISSEGTRITYLLLSLPFF